MFLGRDAARKNPVYNAALASLLVWQAHNLLHAGDEAGALSAASEAAEIGARGERDFRLSETLAIALGMRGRLLLTRGRPKKAISSLEEALDIFRQLAAASETRFGSSAERTKRHRLQVRTCLSDLADLHGETGSYSEGRSEIDEALSLVEHDPTHPFRSKPTRATLLMIQANIEIKAHNYDDALAPGREAIRILRETDRQLPGRNTLRLVSALANHAICENASGNGAASISLITEAIERYCNFVRHNPASFQPSEGWRLDRIHHLVMRNATRSRPDAGDRAAQAALALAELLEATR